MGAGKIHGFIGANRNVLEQTGGDGLEDHLFVDGLKVCRDALVVLRCRDGQQHLTKYMMSILAHCLRATLPHA